LKKIIHIGAKVKANEVQIPSNAHEILQSTKSAKSLLNIAELTTNDIAKKIITDELNRIDFYDIPKVNYNYFNN
jgi:hypothetical protein